VWAGVWDTNTGIPPHPYPLPPEGGEESYITIAHSLHRAYGDITVKTLSKKQDVAE
jgi:hypothetical protein